MACRNAYRTKEAKTTVDTTPKTVTAPAIVKSAKRLLFGVDSKIQANDLLQNNIEEFEWVVRNKIYPNFYGRYLTGENCLTKEEIRYLHLKGCKIAPIYTDSATKNTNEEGVLLAKKVELRALELGIPEGTAIFLEIDESRTITRDFLIAFARTLLEAGYTPGFKANTDARYAFDREFTSGMSFNKEIFQHCLVWAVSPTVKEYNGLLTSHFIHPDTWGPFAPSGMTRNEVAIWQYGVNCHPIEDDTGKQTTFNLDLVRNEQVIIQKMF